MEEVRDHKNHESHHTGLIPTWLCSHKYWLLKNDSILQTRRTENCPYPLQRLPLGQACCPDPSNQTLAHRKNETQQECRSASTAKEKV